MKHKYEIIYATLLALFLLWVLTVRIAPPDLAFYYSYARSFLFDLDFFYGNEYDRFQFGIHETYLSVQGYPANDWPIGTGIAWLPFLLLAHLCAVLANGLGFSISSEGYDWFYQWVVTYGATLLYSGGTLILSYRLCLREGLPKNSALWAVTLIAGGSTYSYHLFVNAADSHPPAAFFLVLFLLLWFRYLGSGNLWIAFAAGWALGMAVLIRPHQAIFLLTPLLSHLLREDRQHTGNTLWGMLILSTTAFITFLPQMAVWKVIYGSWFEIPRSGDVLWTEPYLYETLFSDFHGMFSWSPIFGLGVIGLFVQKRWLPYAIPVLLQIYIYSCNLAWWAGGSFGNRRMVGCVPLLILGLAVLIHTAPKIWFKIFLLLCALWTLLLLLAEVGGTIQLDHFQPWSEIFDAIWAGWLPGLIRLFTYAWQEHPLERILGAIVILLSFISLFIMLSDRPQRFRWLPQSGLVFLFLFILLHLIAMHRSEKALAQADVSPYIPYDRFTWVVYFEEGFYQLQNRRPRLALEAFSAAALIEPRHRQPWMYIGYICHEKGWEKLAYHYSAKSLEKGQTIPSFLYFFENILTQRIFQNGERLHIYYNERGVLRTLLGYFHLARSDFEMALVVKPDYEIARKNIQAMEIRLRGEHAPLNWE